MATKNFALIGAANGTAEYRDRNSNSVVWLKFKTAKKSIDGVSCDNYRTEFISNVDSPVTLGQKTAVDRLAVRTVISGSSLSREALKTELIAHAKRLTALANTDVQSGFVQVDPAVLN